MKVAHDFVEPIGRRAARKRVLVRAVGVAIATVLGYAFLLLYVNAGGAQ